MDAILVYITVENQRQSELISKILLEKRLASCVNIVEGLHSMYWWEGQIQSTKEILLLVKTRKELFEKLCTEVQLLHSYQIPCIIALPIVASHVDFMKWIWAETTDTTP